MQIFTDSAGERKKQESRTEKLRPFFTVSCCRGRARACGVDDEHGLLLL